MIDGYVVVWLNGQASFLPSLNSLESLKHKKVGIKK